MNANVPPSDEKLDILLSPDRTRDKTNVMNALAGRSGVIE
jgi:hypothetical protein